MPSQDQQIDLLQRFLRQPRDSGEIAAALGISQPTVSRLLRKLPDLVPLGAARARKYGLARRAPGVQLPIPVAQISERGELAAFGMLHVLQGGWYALAHTDGNAYTLYQGTPFFLADLHPQGFLGRLEPRRNVDLDLPGDIRQWSAEHVLKYLTRAGENAAGNLILGNETRIRYLEQRRHWFGFAMQEPDRAVLYPQFARQVMEGEPPGSSAGGEQPKFTALVRRGAAPENCEHVIVKFSPPLDTASGRRWADLLICEHLALDVLAGHGVAAARTGIVQGDGRVFLEVARFDRAALFGRLPMVTFAGLDGDLGMADQTWSAVAQVLQSQGRLPAGDARTVEILDLYGALIGNEDKHHGNIAVSWTLSGQLRLLPAYDMLPMLYRPNSHGEIVSRAWSMGSIRKLQLMYLPLCLDMAQEFWRRVQADQRISTGFKAIAATHAQAIAAIHPRPQNA